MKCPICSNILVEHPTINNIYKCSSCAWMQPKQTAAKNCPDCNNFMDNCGDSILWCKFCMKTWATHELLQKDFSTVPVSLAEVRADKAKDGRKWAPRDALVKLLRDIDSGEKKVTEMVIIWSGPPVNPGSENTYGYVQATSSKLVFQGLILEGFKIAVQDE